MIRVRTNVADGEAAQTVKPRTKTYLEILKIIYDTK